MRSPRHTQWEIFGMVSLGMSWRAYGMPPSQQSPPAPSHCRSLSSLVPQGEGEWETAGHTNTTPVLSPERKAHA